ncbi:GNAT family N-acetyltransferase [Roseovarius sp. SYSU LYC5161]|uniref:GNAT family N-acetyltransferase n=1 Tax=Roseovarius halophilus (ex Wu et al. 2025) TaxID=3376060 RepID=UPI002871D365|nr:GNAT family N-acyltransferase [Roseovarius sp.]
MTPLQKGRYRARAARDLDDRQAAQRLRQSAFVGSDRPGELDQDKFDDLCIHVLVENIDTDELVCCYRLVPLAHGKQIDRTYSAQFYDLSALTEFTEPMVEMGRFCICPGMRDPDILRVAWGAMTRYVDDQGIGMLFGCSSFTGINAEDYLDVFALLKQKHIAPRCWRPKIKAPTIFRFAQAPERADEDRRKAMRRMPPLLRTYLLMGGWVSDHAVVDRDLGTLHVFTGLEIGAIPKMRQQLLRAVAQ